MQVVRGLKREFYFIRGNILVLMASWVLMIFSEAIPATYYSLFVLELGGTPFILGLIGFVSSIALAAVQFPGGFLADKYGRRKLIVTMTFGVGLAKIFYALAPSWHLIFVGATIFNFCLIYSPALRAITADSLPSEKRGMGFSAINIIGVVSVASPLVAGFLYVNYGLVRGMRIAYFLVTTCFLAAAILRMKLRETIKASSERIGFMDVIRSYPIAVRESMAVWKVVPRTMLYLFLIFVVAEFFGRMCSPYYVVYATENLSIEKFQWSLLLMLQLAVVFSSALPIGKFVDVFGRKKPLVLSNLLLMLAMPFFIYGDFMKLVTFFVLLGIVNNLGGTAYQSLEADLVPREYRGKVIGFTRFFILISASIGQLLGGFLYEKVSPQLPFLLMLASTVLGVILTSLLIHEPRKKEI